MLSIQDGAVRADGGENTRKNFSDYECDAPCRFAAFLLLKCMTA